MKLKKFVEKFICRNSLVRLWYPTNGGHKMVIQDDENGKSSVCMEWEIIKSEGIYGKYTNHKVIGVTDISTYGAYPESINIVIEEILLTNYI